MSLDLDAQHAHKLQHLSAALRAHGLSFPAIELTRSAHQLGYRDRVRSKITAAGNIEFFNPNKLPSCGVLVPSLRARLATLRAASHQEPELFSPFSHLELRADDIDGHPGLMLAARRDEQAELGAALRRVEAQLREHLVGLRGDPEIACQRRDIQGAVWALVPLDAFWQVNAHVNAALVAELCGAARESGARTALDLYAGAGNFSLPLAASGIDVLAVEIHAAAGRALQNAAQAQGLRCRALTQSAERACHELSHSHQRFDVVIIDAPRAGLRTTALAVAALRPLNLAVVSCNPTSLARDLATLIAEGYGIQTLRAFDMFPHTRHLEVLAWLERLAP